MGTLWMGGTIYTMKKERETVEAVYVEDGIIQMAGKVEGIRKKYGSKITEEINLDGGVMYPGFVDSHLHMIGHGEKLLRLDLSQVTSSEVMRQRLIEKSTEGKGEEWIIGEGWNENNFPDRKIFHREELDEIAPSRPMMLSRICRHALLANSKALELAGINDETPDPPGGVIVRDNDGKATGYLLDNAQNLVQQIVPQKSEAELQYALETGVRDLLRLGLVGGHTEDLHYHGGFRRTFDAFRTIIDGDEIKFRAHLLVHNQVVGVMHEDGWTYGSGTEFVRFDAMKIFADGALGGRTALLSHPYNDVPDTSGVAIYDLDEFKSIVEKARLYEMPVVIHTIGDLALEYAITAIEAYPPPEGLRDRLVHVQVARPELIERLKKLPVVLDIQPQFVASDFPWVIERLGEERMTHSFAWKTLLDEGLHCAGGSDAPIERPDPLLGIHAAVARKKPGEPGQGYYPEQKLSVYEAVSLYTEGSAYVIGKESTRGKISEGFTADFTVLDRDLFTIPEDDIPNAEVKMTVVDNTVMFDSRE
ncbi:MAG TPA: amidohydrolase [Bacillales bacterium]|nr:amidohydrolase [Bacillales bacterium]